MGYPSVLLTCAVVLTILTTATSKHTHRTRHTPGVVVRQSSESGRIFDISHKYVPELPSFGTAKGLRPFLNLTNDIRKNCSTYNSVFTLPTHAGTHVDAPSHVYTKYFDQGIDVDTLDLYSLNGPAVLVDVPRDSNITVKVLESFKIQRGVKRMLFRTLNTDRGLMLKKEFDSSYVGFTEDAAKWLVQNTDIKLVGLDYLSVAAMDFLIPTHLVLLGKRDIILVEGLKLDNIKAGQYTLHCLPLRLTGAEASPTRCILIN